MYTRYALKVSLGAALLYAFIGALACWGPHFLVFYGYPNLTLGNELGFLAAGAFLGAVIGLFAAVSSMFAFKNRRKEIRKTVVMGAGVAGLIFVVMSFCGSIIAAA